MNLPLSPHLDPRAPTPVWAGLVAVVLLFALFAAVAITRGTVSIASRPAIPAAMLEGVYPAGEQPGS